MPVDEAISAGHTPAQNPARGVIDPGAAIVDNSVSAGQTPAQDSARGVVDGGTPVQDSAGGPVQDSAPLGKERTTKKEQPPAGPLPGPGEPDGPRLTPMTTNTPDPASELARVIRQNLPDRLRLQLANSTITPRAEALARAGWTETTLTPAITHRTWTGAGAGAVITWLTDLAANRATSPRSRAGGLPIGDAPAPRPARCRATRIRCLGVPFATTGPRVGGPIQQTRTSGPAAAMNVTQGRTARRQPGAGVRKPIPKRTPET